MSSNITHRDPFTTPEPRPEEASDKMDPSMSTGIVRPEQNHENFGEWFRGKQTPEAGDMDDDGDVFMIDETEFDNLEHGLHDSIFSEMNGPDNLDHFLGAGPEEALPLYEAMAQYAMMDDDSAGGAKFHDSDDDSEASTQRHDSPVEYDADGLEKHQRSAMHLAVISNLVQMSRDLDAMIDEDGDGMDIDEPVMKMNPFQSYAENTTDYLEADERLQQVYPGAFEESSSEMASDVMAGELQDSQFDQGIYAEADALISLDEDVPGATSTVIDAFLRDVMNIEAAAAMVQNPEDMTGWDPNFGAWFQDFMGDDEQGSIADEQSADSASCSSEETNTANDVVPAAVPATPAVPVTPAVPAPKTNIRTRRTYLPAQVQPARQLRSQTSRRVLRSGAAKSRE